MKLFSFRKPQASELAHRALKEYEVHLLEQEAAASYHSKLVEYYKDGIKRLKAQTATAT